MPEHYHTEATTMKWEPHYHTGLFPGDQSISVRRLCVIEHLDPVWLLRPWLGEGNPCSHIEPQEFATLEAAKLTAELLYL